MNEDYKEIIVEIGKEVAQEAYEDIAKPATIATGNVLGLIPRCINAKLEPLHKWILEKEYNIEATKRILAVKLSAIRPDKIITPETYIAVPALQAISYCMDCDEIREMYANLLATSMNYDKKSAVHPAFVEIIKQLTPDEAKLINAWYGKPALIDFEFQLDPGHGYFGKNYTDISPELDCKENLDIYISNLIRLGILEKIQTEKNSCFDWLEKAIFQECKEEMAEYYNESTLVYQPFYYWLEITSFGEDFREVCLGDNCIGRDL